MRYRVTLAGRLVFTSGKAIDEEARKALNEVFGALNVLGDASGNAAICLDAPTGDIRIECGVEALTSVLAIKRADEFIVSALGAGGITAPDGLPAHGHPSWHVESWSTANAVPMAA
jgi:hypothetical protein